jgi:lycopene beta-cyclase
MPHYDYIFAGAGAAGLSLLTRMIASGKFSDKKILLIDKAPKTSNDRTWCFWEKENSFFEEIVYRKWDHLLFESNTFSAPLDIAPYQYKMIRGIDFYNFCFHLIKQQANIEIVYGEIRFERLNENKTSLYIDDLELNTEKSIVFNSIPFASPSHKKTLHLLQHFKGWIIETNEKKFDSGVATLMDFRVQQDHGATFVYVLPLDANRVLVEYTLFTEKLLSTESYDKELHNYISQFMQLREYTVKEEEFGIIPMTNARFPFYQNGIYHIGTAGGQTKASTGYTFQFIQKQSRHIVERLESNQSLNDITSTPARFRFYDSVLLQLLVDKIPEGHEIFTRLFRCNKASDIFKFLDNETTLREELRIISSLQFAPFLKAAIKQLI